MKTNSQSPTMPRKLTKCEDQQHSKVPLSFSEINVKNPRKKLLLFLFAKRRIQYIN